MKTIRVSDIFYGLQGEGIHMGVPSVFVKTWGCNFTCSGYSMPKSEKQDERAIIAANISQYKEYRNLPSVNTGCDSYGSWDSRFISLSKMVTTQAIAETAVSLLPSNKWREEHLVFTGGEPLYGNQPAICDLLRNELLAECTNITFETNGTQDLSLAFERALTEWNQRFLPSVITNESITFSVSPKLSASGENWIRAIQPKVIRQYLQLGSVHLKFAISTRMDADEAMRAYREYQAWGFNGSVYFMPIGGTEKTYKANLPTVSELAAEYGVRFSARMQFDFNRAKTLS